jgi:hypothetical protein
MQYIRDFLFCIVVFDFDGGKRQSTSKSGAVVKVTVTFTHFSGNAHHFFPRTWGFPLLRQAFLERDLFFVNEESHC